MDALQVLKNALYQIFELCGFSNAIWGQAPIGTVTPYVVFMLSSDPISLNSKKEVHNFIISVESYADDSQIALQNYSIIHSNIQDVVLNLGVDWQNYYSRRVKLIDHVGNVEGNVIFVSGGFYEFRVAKSE